MKELIGPLEIRRRLICEKRGRQERIRDMILRFIEGFAYGMAYGRVPRWLYRKWEQEAEQQRKLGEAMAQKANGDVKDSV